MFRVAEDEVLVRGGLLAGERVCISPLETVVDGMLVRVRDETARGAPLAAPREEPEPRS